MSTVGLVVHPTRPVDQPLDELKRWAQERGIGLVQVRAWCDQRQVADEGTAGETDLIVALGGDGTTLAALRASVDGGRPVLGVACGSLGVLTAVAARDLGRALQRFSAGEWVPNPIPALEVSGAEQPLHALNDVVVVRGGGGQVRLAALLDGALFARIAGDGCIVSTPVGSSAYALAAGGPLLMPQTEGFLLTPLPTHGGSCPPLVLPATSILELQVTSGYGGARLEVDGQIAGTDPGRLKIGYRPAVATLVAFADQEPFLVGLRRRKIIADSPRILAEDHPEAGESM